VRNVRLPLEADGAVKALSLVPVDLLAVVGLGTALPARILEGGKMPIEGMQLENSSYIFLIMSNVKANSRRRFKEHVFGLYSLN